MRRSRTIIHAAAVMAIAASLTLAGPAGAHVRRSRAQAPRWVTKVVTVSSPYQDTTTADGDGIRCDHFTANEARCRLLVTGSAQWTGTLQGGASYVLDAWFDTTAPGRLLYESTGDQGNHFVDVTVEGCGRGGFLMEEWDGRVDIAPPANYDLTTNRGEGFNKWRVRPGSGTGQLVGLTGSGVNNWTYHDARHPVQYGNYGEGIFTGTVTCRVPAA